jgi:glutaredoxin
MNFTVYSKAGCPYCDKIKRVLSLAELNFTVQELGVDFDREEFYAQFGVGSTFPQVLIGDHKLGGCTESVKYLRENNII